MPDIKDQVLKACRHVMGPIARLLLRSGVTWREFSELSKEVFVDIARRDYGIHGRPTNTARVAMITGISRREVTRVRKVLVGEEVPQPPEPSRISQILTGWHLDPDFTDADGQPLELPPEGDVASLAVLFKRHAGDLPHRALTKELIRLGLIEETAGGRFRVLQRDYIRKQVDPTMVNQMAIALHDHAATLTHNLNVDRREPARFERMASNPNFDPRYIEAFIALIEERGQAFLEEMDAWLSHHDLSHSARARERGRRMGVGIYLFCDDSRKGDRT